MPVFRSLAILGFLASGSILAAMQSQGEGKTGIKVGEKAPSFTLKDFNGTDRSLDDFLKKGPVALVFFRSADW